MDHAPFTKPYRLGGLWGVMIQDAPKSGCLVIVSIAPVKSGTPFACWLARFLHIYLYISHTNGTSSVSPHHDISPLMAVSSCALFRRHRQWWRAQRARRAQGPLTVALLRRMLFSSCSPGSQGKFLDDHQSQPPRSCPAITAITCTQQDGLYRLEWLLRLGKASCGSRGP